MASLEPPVRKRLHVVQNPFLALPKAASIFFRLGQKFGRRQKCLLLEYHCSTKSAVFIVYSPVSYEPLNSTCAKRYVRSLHHAISSSRWRARERRECSAEAIGLPLLQPK